MIFTTKLNSILCAISLLALPAYGQGQLPFGSPIDGSTPPSLAQGSPAGSYALSGFETVNLFNGGLSFKLPLVQMKGRGGSDIPLYLPIERKWVVNNGDGNGYYLRWASSELDPNYAPNATGYSRPGRLLIRETGRNLVTNCTSGETAMYQDTLTRISFVQSDGTEMEFVDAKTGGAIMTTNPSISGAPTSTILCPGQAVVSRGRVWVTRDGSFATLVLDNDLTDGTGYSNAPPNPIYAGTTAHLFLKDGTRYKFSGQNLVQIRDRNGNTTDLTYNGLRLASMRDSIGRTLSIQYDQITSNSSQVDSYDTISYPGFGGLPKQVKVHYCAMDGKAPPEYVSNPPLPPRSCPFYAGTVTQTYAALFGLNGSTSTHFNPRVPTFVELPDGRRYEFQYNEFGELTRVKLPTGGGFGYEWGSGYPNNSNGLGYPYVLNPFIYRRVKKRIVYSSGDTVEGQTTYSASEFAGPSGDCLASYCTLVQLYNLDAAGSAKEGEWHSFHGSSGSPDTYFDANYYASPIEGREYNVTKLSSVVNIPPTYVSKSDTVWEQRACVSGEVCPTAFGPLRASARDPRVKKTTSTLLDTGEVSSQEVVSFDRYNNPLVTDETGFTGPYRRRSRTYVDTLSGKSYTRPLASDGVTISETAPDINKTIHIRGLVQQETLTDLTTNPGNLVSTTDYDYDVHTSAAPRRATRSASGAPNIDPLVPNERGNLTQVSQRLYALPPTIPTTKDLLTNFLYDDAGNVVKTVDPRGSQTTITFSTSYAAAWPTAVLNAAGHTVSTAYDFSTGAATSFTDANSRTTTYARSGDPLDRLTSVSMPDGGLTEFKYCDAGSTASCESGMELNSFRKKVKQDSCGPNTVVSDGAYDGLGRSIKETQFENGSTKIIRQIQYDFLGRPFRVSNPTRSAAGTDFTETRFDGAGRMVKTFAPDLSETIYTPIGSELTITDPANRKTKQKKDAFGRLTSVTEDPGGTLQSTTNYRYSVQDDLLAVCQGGVFSGATCVGGKERTFRYDSLRRLASATNPESGETLYTYDDAGNLTTKRDGNMISVNTTYDAIQRPLLRTYSDGTTPDVTYTWDQATLNGIGRMNRVANSVSTTDYLEFDAMGRVLKSRQTTNTTPYNFEYQYNLAGGMSLEKYPSLREVRSCYDEAGRISQVKQKANATAPETVVANLTGYAPHGAVTGMTLGTSLVTETTLHDPKRLQVQQLTASTVAAGNWQMNLYYCPGESLLCTTNNGNIVRQKGYGGAAWDYSYDSLNRLELTTENVNGTYKWHQRMKYDPFGNRWILNETGTLIPNLEATPRAQLASDPSPFTSNNQWNGASYDPGGNQTTTWGNGTAVGAAKYFYDAENRIKKAEVNWPVGGAGVVEHGYDGDGRRIWKKVGGVVKTTFVYNAAGQLVAEYGESAAMPCTTCYLTADHLGSTRVVWGSDGAMKQLLDYAPFGEEVGANYRGGDVRYPGGLYPRPGGMGVSMEFTGKERDAETGLDYFLSRYFSAAQGRFTSADSLMGKPEWLADPQRWNRYAYVRNNPLKFIDPNGEDLIVYIYFAKDLTESEKRYLEQNMSSIISAVTDKFKKAGIKDIEFRAGSSLTDKQVKAILSQGKSTSTTGIGMLNFADKKYGGFQSGDFDFGATGTDNRSAVFLGQVGRGLDLSNPEDLKVMNFRMGEIASHELGHGQGFESDNKIVNYMKEFFGQGNLMGEGQGIPKGPKQFDNSQDRTKRAIKEINRIGDNTPKR